MTSGSASLPIASAWRSRPGLVETRNGAGLASGRCYHSAAVDKSKPAPSSQSWPMRPCGGSVPRAGSDCPHFVQKRAPSLNCSAPHFAQTAPAALISSPRAARYTDGRHHQIPGRLGRTLAAWRSCIRHSDKTFSISRSRARAKRQWPARSDRFLLIETGTRRVRLWRSLICSRAHTR